MHEADAALTVTTWGPSLVLLLAVLLAVWLAREVWRREDPKRVPRRVSHAILSSGDFDELNIALESATALNAYNIHAQNDPGVHLRAVVRFTPLDFEGSVHEVMQSF